jgi:2-polyprenyl-3-methyl-5-hydroxy-6-metoxy-1,4-benzoquinol methylase
MSAAERVAGYETDRPDVQAHVPADARSVLELGCAAGALGAALKARQGATVVGVELDALYAAEAALRLDRVVVADAESFLGGAAPPEAPFDVLICADVLEHLADPWTALHRAVSLLRPGGTAIVSLPNVLFWGALLRLVREQRWPREAEGIFDRTHLRWFSRDDAVDLLRGAGLRDVRVEPRYWVEGAALRRRQALARTPLAPYLAPQHLLTGVR